MKLDGDNVRIITSYIYIIVGFTLLFILLGENGLIHTIEKIMWLLFFIYAKPWKLFKNQTNIHFKLIRTLLLILILLLIITDKVPMW
ncbi:MAG: hypothetical protein LBU40_01390 [Methanobrevibacter sp.]|jgi:hypothetical protein|nr:hypothetical protein [Methanobrevibacter sp.]